MLTLLVLQGPDKGQRFQLPDELTVVGRGSSQVPLTDNTVSRRHCEISTNDGVYVLTDLGSANGTYINSLRVRSRQTIRIGDQLRVGRTLMVFGSLAGKGTPGPSLTGASLSGASLSGFDAVELAGEEAGVDSAIMHTVGANDDSLVLAVPDPGAAAASNLQILYQLSAALGAAFDVRQAMAITLDLVFEHVNAERGMVLLRSELADPAASPIDFSQPATEPNPPSRPGEGEPPEPRTGATDLLTPVVVRRRDLPAASPHGTSRSAASPPAPPDPPDPSGAPGAADPPLRASRTIISHVLTSGEGVLSSNAMADRRFSKGRSVHDLGIRSALCVPIKARPLVQRAPPADAAPARLPVEPAPSPTASPQATPPSHAGEVLGVLYIDSSVRNYTYSPDQLRLLSAIGLQAGMAVQNVRLYQAALRAERLAAIGETTAALSHSIKNILQALRGGADVVDMGLAAGNLPQAAKGWSIVSRNLERIYGLTLNLLAYSRPRTPDLRAVSIPRLLRECVETLAPTAGEKGVMVVPDLDDDQPPAHLDEDAMHQVVMNLLSNALDAVAPKTGLITLKSHYDPATDHAVVEVLDNGPGIAPTMRDHLFELFHSTKGNRGTGLGLAVSRKIVEEHGGVITAESPVTGGTLFRIRLPLHRGPDPTDSWASEGTA